MTRLLPLLVLLGACKTTPALQGVVLDQWGEPIPEATVAIEGTIDRPLTDSDGVFTLPVHTGVLQMKAGKEGYIQEHLEYNVETAEGRPTFKLWEKPPENGFYVVGTAKYHRIDKQPVEIVGASSSTIQGLRDIGQARAEGELRVVFHTELREHEIATFDLELHKLDFVKSAEVMSVEGPMAVDVHLYTSSGNVESLEITPLRSKSDYLLTATGLEPGYYAFNSLHLLDMKDSDRFEKIPKELRVVFPFELKE